MQLVRDLTRSVFVKLHVYDNCNYLTTFFSVKIVIEKNCKKILFREKEKKEKKNQI